MVSSPCSYLFTSVTGRIRVHTAPKYGTKPIRYKSRFTFAVGAAQLRTVTESAPPQPLLCVNSMSSMIFVAAQKLFGKVWTCLKSTVFRKVTLLLTSLLVLERSRKHFEVNVILNLLWSQQSRCCWPLTADRHSCSRTFVGTILQ